MPKKEVASRTTFSISDDTIDRIKRLSEKLETSANKIIELSLSIELIVEVAVSNSKKKTTENKSKLLKKVYAIKPDTRVKLNKISKENIIPIDVFIANLMFSLEAVLLLQEKKQKENEEKAYQIISKILTQVCEAESKLKQLLDEDHPAYDDFAMGVGYIYNAEAELTEN